MGRQAQRGTIQSGPTIDHPKGPKYYNGDP